MKTKRLLQVVFALCVIFGGFIRTAIADTCTPGARTFGLTIIAHGYASGVNGWVTDMANSINCRMGGDVPIHTLKIVRSGGGVVLAAPIPQINDIVSRGAGILLVDWSDADAGVCGLAVPTHEIADVVFEFLGQRPQLIALPMHLIGHSRGGSVMSRVAYDLANFGIWVDQLTFLDPRPILGGCAVPDFPLTSPPVSGYVWGNVLFADNYFQGGGVGGIAVNGTYQSDLTGIVTGDGYNCDGNDLQIFFNANGIAHEQIHTYYHGTILCGSACVDGVLVQSRWYDEPNPGGWRRQTGFYFSRTGGGDQYGAQAVNGLNYRLSGAAQNNRASAVTLAGAAWPNAIFKPLANYNLQANAQINFTYFYLGG